ncbi:MAG: methyltransferase, CheR-type, partial [Gemmatimonadetes bacterium]|nr:methyltransferase, CheR-type [Gemmatimonadota bacterium]
PRVDARAAAQDDAAAYAAADYVLAESLAREAVARADAEAASWIILVRAVANQGLLREADDLCAQALDQQRLSAELHYLHATLLSAAGQYRESANAARRALYLDRAFVMAHMQMGDALARLGEPARARRAFESVLAALATLPDDAVVTAADGVPASRLRQIAELRLRTLATGSHA